MTIANIHGPNTDNDEIFHKVFSIISTFSQSKIIIGGDFNTVLNPSLDKSNNINHTKTWHSTDTIKQSMNELGLSDTWRLNNPITRDYTYCSPVHKSYSRIDFFLTSNSIIQDITDTKINPIIISDHTPITLMLSNKKHTKIKQRWRMNTSLLQDKEFNEYFEREWTSFLEINDTPSISASTLWETTKVVLRGKIISYSTYKHKTNQKQEEDLENKLKILNNTYSQNSSEQTLTEINKIKYKLEEIILKVQFQKQRLKFLHFEHNDKSGKYLANLLKQNKEKTLITTIKNSENKIHNPQEINKTFRTFYKSLYSNKQKENRRKTDLFLKSTGIPTLNPTQIQTLEEPLTVEEYRKALFSLSNNKAPGLDEYPSEFYKHFWPIISPLFSRMKEDVKIQSTIPQYMNTALITVLLKPNKDPSLCSSYHPLSLINTDMKIISKALATRLESVMPTLIHQDQTGFIKGRNSSNNTR